MKTQSAYLNNECMSSFPFGADILSALYKPPVKVKVPQLCPTLWDPINYKPWNSPGQNTRVGSHSIHQGIFPTQRSKSGLPHCRQILYQLKHKGNPRTLKWIAYPFSRAYSWHSNQTRDSCIAGGFFTKAIREASYWVAKKSQRKITHWEDC